MDPIFIILAMTKYIQGPIYGILVKHIYISHFGLFSQIILGLTYIFLIQSKINYHR